MESIGGPPDFLLDSWIPMKIALVIGIITFIRYYMKGPECPPSSLPPKGKTVLITGGNSGIGKATALEFAVRGARVILACRCTKRGEIAADEIKIVSGNSEVFVMGLDLSSLDNVREFAEEFNKKEEHLDILINNAGVMMCPFEKTVDGNEMHFAVNYLGHFLLTHLLLDKLKESPEGRIVNVSAIAHYVAAIRFDNINFEENYIPREAYGQSKLAQVMFTRQLSKRLAGTNVIVNAVHPGIVRGTNLMKHTPLANILLKILTFPLTWLLMKTPKDGAQTILYAAISTDVEGVTGKYFSDCQIKTPSEEALDNEKSQKLWEISLHLAGLQGDQ